MKWNKDEREKWKKTKDAGKDGEEWGGRYEKLFTSEVADFSVLHW